MDVRDQQRVAVLADCQKPLALPVDSASEGIKAVPLSQRAPDSMSRQDSLRTLSSEESGAESGADSSWMVRQQSQNSLGYPPGLFSPSQGYGLPTMDAPQSAAPSKYSAVQSSVVAEHYIHSQEPPVAFGSSFPAFAQPTSEQPLFAQRMSAVSGGSMHTPQIVPDVTLSAWKTPHMAGSGSAARPNSSSFTFPAMPPGLSLNRSSSAPHINRDGAIQVPRPAAATAQREIWQSEAVQHQQPLMHSLQTPFDSRALFPMDTRLAGCDIHARAVEHSDEYVLHRAAAPGTAVITPEAAQRRADQLQGTSPGVLTPETFRTAVESPQSSIERGSLSKQSSQSAQDFRSALTDMQSPDSAQRFYSVPVWTPESLQHTAESRLAEPQPLDDGMAEEDAEQLQQGFSDSHDADESASDCYSATETPFHHGDSLQRALSFSSLQTVDEEEEPDDGSAFKEAGRARRAKLATPQARPAGRLSSGAPGKPEGRRKRGGRSRSKLHQGGDSGGRPGTPRGSERANRPGGPLKLSDVIIPALKAKAKKQGLAFITSPGKGLEEDHAEDRGRPVAEPAAEPYGKLVQLSAVCDNRSFAEVTRAVAAADLEEQNSNFLSAAEEESCSPDTAPSPQRNPWQQQKTCTSAAWQQAILTDLQQAAESPAAGIHIEANGSPGQYFSTFEPKKTQELLSSEEMQALLGSHSKAGPRRSVENAHIANGFEEAQHGSGKMNDALGATTVRHQALEFSKDPVIDMQRTNKHLGPVTCPLKVLLPLHISCKA